MMKQTLTVLLSIFFLNALGQEKIALDSVKNYFGKLVQVSGKVAKISALGKGESQQIVIYIGGESPSEKLAVILNSGGKGELQYLLKDNRFSKGLVIVTGIVDLLKGKARITLNDDQNLSFIIDEEVPIQ